MTTDLKRWLAIGLVSALPVTVAAGCAENAEMAKAPSAPQPIPQDQISATEVARAIEAMPQPDQDFVRQAAGANMAAIRFGQLALQRGGAPEVKTLAKQMVDSHTALSDQLRERARREGVTLPIAPMTPEQQALYANLSQLEGPAFDQAYLNSVRQIQQQTIASFQNEAVHGQSPSLADFANQMLPSLNERARYVQRQFGQM